MGDSNVEDEIISMYIPYIENETHKISTAKFESPNYDKLISLCNKTKQMMSEMYKETIFEIEHPATVIGDIHGNMKDLLLIFRNFGTPADRKYLFIGDYVDRGLYSTPVISLLFAFYLKYPQNMTLIKGNHEISKINSEYGFLKELKTIYGDSNGYALWLQFNSVFTYLPLCCIISKIIFCVHGGLSPLLHTLDDLRMVTMPIRDVDRQSPIINDVLWSDPSETNGFKRNNRGQGYLFGYDKLYEFLQKNKFKLLVRGHQCTNTGVTLFASNLGLTVFSSSNYCRLLENKCGVFCMEGKSDFTLHSLTFTNDNVNDFVINMKCYPKRFGLIRAFNQNARTPITGIRHAALKTPNSPQVGGTKTPRSLQTGQNKATVSRTIAQNKMRMMHNNDNQQQTFKQKMQQMTMKEICEMMDQEKEQQQKQQQKLKEQELDLKLTVENKQQAINKYKQGIGHSSSEFSLQNDSILESPKIQRRKSEENFIYMKPEERLPNLGQNAPHCQHFKPATPQYNPRDSTCDECENLNRTKGQILDIFLSNKEEKTSNSDLQNESIPNESHQNDKENSINTNDKENKNETITISSHSELDENLKKNENSTTDNQNPIQENKSEELTNESNQRTSYSSCETKQEDQISEFNKKDKNEESQTKVIQNDIKEDDSSLIFDDVVITETEEFNHESISVDQNTKTQTPKINKNENKLPTSFVFIPFGNSDSESNETKIEQKIIKKKSSRSKIPVFKRNLL